MGHDGLLGRAVEASNGHPKVTVLLATRNGMPHLPAQIESLGRQTGVDLRLRVSDDGSTDGTAAYLADLRARSAPGRVTLAQGPGRGYAANFTDLARNTPQPAGCVAFCDQDDVWEDDRLQRATTALAASGEGSPALHVAARRLTDADLRPQGLWTLPIQTLDFRNALIESVLPGNAAVMNPAAFRLLQTALIRSPAVTSHDWAMYQILAGVEARLYLDPTPLILYRQHQANTLGAGGNLRWLRVRLRHFLHGGYGRDLRAQRAFLHENRALLTPRNQARLDDSAGLFVASLPARLTAMRRARPYRLAHGDQLAVWARLLFGGLSG